MQSRSVPDCRARRRMSLGGGLSLVGSRRRQSRGNFATLLGALVAALALTLAPGRAIPAQDAYSPPPDSPSPAGSPAPTPAKDSPPVAAAGSPMEKETVEQLAQRARKSVVVVTIAGREGQQQGLGTGFVVAAEGLIATNLHVIGEARPISVQLEDGTKFEVTEVFASDRAQDLAIVRIDPKSKNRELTPLPLAEGEELPAGMPVVAVGNPLGLQHSVVTGVVSGVREIDERRMIQLAIPIEPGNSGGPVLDAAGRVVGIVTMKSQVTKNLGFAVEIAALRQLLAKPNPVAMAKWLTIGVIDPREWTTLFGARWQQRAGRIVTSGLGGGFGGRSLCLAKRELPEPPFELAVSVKLDDERGAAGLVFHADGRDRHYGFYPSGGKLRLSRFEGPDVFSWQVLAEQPSEHYRAGEWNQLKVRIERDGFVCFVNGEQVFESRDDAFKSGQVGLAKFRETAAEFKQFRVAKELPDGRLTGERLRDLQSQIDALPPLDGVQMRLLAPLAEQGAQGVEAVRRRVQQLRERADELERVAHDLHRQRVCRELEKLAKSGPNFDLLEGALLVAWLDDEELDLDSYRRQVERMASEVKTQLAAEATAAERVAALNKYLFVEQGFHGSRTEYYHRGNSYINRVIDDREGIPITLSVLYLELARRIGLTIEGVPLPGHFVVRYRKSDDERPMLDVFEGGRELSREAAEKLVRDFAGRALLPQDLEAPSASQIVQRMLRNLIGVAQEAKDSESLLGYLDALLALDPEAIGERGMRALVRFETGRRDAAVADADWLLEKMPPELDLERVHQMRAYFLRGRR